MIHLLEYHEPVRRRIPAPVVIFGLLFLSTLLVSTGYAQINGVPASVTSPGFGGREINGTPSSVTSLGPRGFAPGPRHGGHFFATVPNAPRRNHDGDGRHHSRDFVPFFGGAYAVPYPVDGASDGSDSGDDSDYQGGPTVFDRRGPGPDAYVPPVKDAEPAHNAEAAPAGPPTPEPAQPPTVLVFKDGRQLQVANYAIVGQTLYDLTAGHPRKVALADLDLEATQKLNEDHGVIFQVPPSAQAN